MRFLCWHPQGLKVAPSVCFLPELIIGDLDTCFLLSVGIPLVILVTLLLQMGFLFSPTLLGHGSQIRMWFQALPSAKSSPPRTPAPASWGLVSRARGGSSDPFPPSPSLGLPRAQLGLHLSLENEHVSVPLSFGASYRLGFALNSRSS